MVTKMIVEMIFLAMASYMLYIDRNEKTWIATLWAILVIYFLSWVLADSYILLGGRI